MTAAKSVPSVFVSYARTGSSTRSNELGMRPMQERAHEKRGEQYLLVKGASGQAVQNMNLVCGLPETTGLGQQPLFS